MNLFKKCPVCNKRFTFKEIVSARAKEIQSSNKNKGSVYCFNCNTNLRVKNPIYRSIYIFFMVPLLVILFGPKLDMFNIFLQIVIILIAINILIILFDVIEHRFNKYVTFAKK